MEFDKIKFKISQLRKDAQHFALESLSLSMLCLLLFIGAPSVFPEIINPYLASSLKIMQAFIVIPLAFWLIVLISNMVRMVKISKLNKKLFPSEAKSPLLVFKKLKSSKKKKK